MADYRENKISGFNFKSEFKPRSILLALGVSISEALV